MNAEYYAVSYMHIHTWNGYLGRVFCLLNRGTLHLKYLAVILVIQWDRQMDKNYIWSVFKPKWFSRSTDPGYGSCCNDNICSTLRSGKDTPFTFHAHWIGQRLLVSEDFLEDHTHTHALSERVSAACSIAFPCKITTVYFQNIVVPTGRSVYCLATIRKFSQESWLTCCP